MQTRFGVIGGGARYAELARLLERDGYAVECCGQTPDDDDTYNAESALERALSAEVVILPMPLCGQDGVLGCAGRSVAEIFDQLSPEQRILAGQVRTTEHQEAARRGLLLTDYFLQESMAVANAAATAEAAIQVSMTHLRETLLGKKSLVLGFGRIGKLLCPRLRGLGVHVAATARKAEDLAWIRALGYRALETESLHGELSEFSLVYNTIPSPVLHEPLLRNCRRDAF